MTKLEEQRHILAEAAKDAIRVIENVKAEAFKVNNAQNSTDHDLLIKISTLVEGLIIDIKDIKTNTVGRFGTL